MSNRQIFPIKLIRICFFMQIYLVFILLNRFCFQNDVRVSIIKGYYLNESSTLNANGDGTFVVSGQTINLKTKMLKFQGLL
jgi:hypothetical protein